jgi:alpha-ketoglutarate-dependent taurine dioxygenase
MPRTPFEGKPRFESPALKDLEDGGVMIAREAREEERRYPTLDRDVPLVLEARAGRVSVSGSLGALRDHLARREGAVMDLVYRHGAILLRGFPVASTRDFEETLLCLRSLRPMRGYFMAELGRVLVRGSTSVFHTNAFVKTGGSLYFGGFHSENYYSSDVPAFIAFCCFKAPWLGGETGIVHMARAYQELSETLKAKLEAEPSYAISWTLASIAGAYGVSEAAAEELCREVGFSIATIHGERRALLEKPNVVVHPVTGRPSLHLNVSAEIRGVDEHLRRRMSSAFDGPEWTLHRLGWRYPKAGSAVESIYRVVDVLHKPKVMSELVSEYVIEPFKARRRAASSPSAPPPPRAGRLLDEADVRALAEAMGRHTSLFTWRPGDILLLDNLQMLHNGMPGLGARHIEAALFNPIPMRWPIRGGAMRALPDDGYASVFERVSSLAARDAAAR